MCFIVHWAVTLNAFGRVIDRRTGRATSSQSAYDAVSESKRTAGATCESAPVEAPAEVYAGAFFTVLQPDARRISTATSGISSRERRRRFIAGLFIIKRAVLHFFAKQGVVWVEFKGFRP